MSYDDGEDDDGDADADDDGHGARLLLKSMVFDNLWDQDGHNVQVFSLFNLWQWWLCGSINWLNLT